MEFVLALEACTYIKEDLRKQGSLMVRIAVDDETLAMAHSQLDDKTRGIIDLLKFARSGQVGGIVMGEEERSLWVQIQGSPNAPPTKEEVAQIKQRASTQIYTISSQFPGAFIG